MTELKMCKQCGRKLPLFHFEKSLQSSYGLKSRCKECKPEDAKSKKAEAKLEKATAFKVYGEIKKQQPTVATTNSIPKWGNGSYAGETSDYQRNDGNKHIKSVGVRC